MWFMVNIYITERKRSAPLFDMDSGATQYTMGTPPAWPPQHQKLIENAGVRLRT